MTHPPLYEAHPGHGLPVDATIAPQSIQDVLVVLSDAVALALHLFRYTHETPELASSRRHVLNAAAEIRNAQQVLMPTREEGPRA